MSIGRGIPIQKAHEDLVVVAKNIGNEVFQVLPFSLPVSFLTNMHSLAEPRVKARRLSVNQQFKLQITYTNLLMQLR